VRKISGQLSNAEGATGEVRSPFDSRNLFQRKANLLKHSKKAETEDELMVQEQHSEQENDKNSSNTKMPVIKVMIPGIS
jgi:hypothetical protein